MTRAVGDCTCAAPMARDLPHGRYCTRCGRSCGGEHVPARAPAEFPLLDDALHEAREEIARLRGPIDIRPSCIACHHKWMPPEGVDALRAPCNTCALRADLGRAVAALQEANDHTVAMRVVQAPSNTDAEREAVYQTFRRIGRILADPTSAQAGELHEQVQRTLSQAARLSAYVLHPDTPGDENMKRIAADVRDEIAAVDARRGGKL